jgi:hypothetical protein
MPQINAITGLKRKQPRRAVTRKKRDSLSSTVAGRMLARQAMEMFPLYMESANRALTYTAVLLAMPDDPEVEDMADTFLMVSMLFYLQAMEMVRLDHHYMDVKTESDLNAGFRKELVDITLQSFGNDDECASKTRFTKGNIQMLIQKVGLGPEVRVYYGFGSYYKFKSETLLIYMLRKMSTARTHTDLADSEFGGCSKRWGTGYNFLVRRFDRVFAPLIGPTGLRAWAPSFPYFAECIREYICRSKERVSRQGEVTYRGMQNGWIPPGQFNVFSFTDCTFYEVSRPGSGPANNNAGSPRRANWYVKQRAFYSGYQRGMEACLKILTICLPNGMTAAIYGPTSGRDEDKALFRLAEFDDYIQDLCQEYHNNTMFCTYGDGIFAGYWMCLRTSHMVAPGMPLTDVQIDQNENMKSARESIELSYGKAEQLWPALNRKAGFKVDANPHGVFAEIRVMYLLTNFVVCALEGSTMTGDRGFRCPPPQLEEYLNMVEDPAD